MPINSYSLITSSPFGIEVNDLFKGSEWAIVHVRSGQYDILQSRRFECAINAIWDYGGATGIMFLPKEIRNASYKEFIRLKGGGSMTFKASNRS